MLTHYKLKVLLIKRWPLPVAPESFLLADVEANQGRELLSRIVCHAQQILKVDCRGAKFATKFATKFAIKFAIKFTTKESVKADAKAWLCVLRWAGFKIGWGL